MKDMVCRQTGHPPFNMHC